MSVGWEGGRPRTRFSPLYVRRLYAEHSTKGFWAGGVGGGAGGAQSVVAGLPTAFTDHHPGIAAMGGAKGTVEPPVPGEVPAPTGNAGRIYCGVGRGPAALARRVQHVSAPPRSVFIYKNHLEERLLDQAQARASYTPLFWGHSRSIPQGMILDVQPLVKSLFCPIRASPNGFFDFEASTP